MEISVGRRGSFYFMFRARGQAKASLTSVGKVQVTKVNEDGTVNLLFPRGGVNGQSETQFNVKVCLSNPTERCFVPTQVSEPIVEATPAAKAAADHAGSTPLPASTPGGNVTNEHAERIGALEARATRHGDAIEELQAAVARLSAAAEPGGDDLEEDEVIDDEDEPDTTPEGGSAPPKA